MEVKEIKQKMEETKDEKVKAMLTELLVIKEMIRNTNTNSATACFNVMQDLKKL